MKLSYRLILVLLLPFSAGCEQLGMEAPGAEQAREEAEGKAIGGACRQAGRALEDCYQLNRRSPKAAIFAGWRDMDGYMRENKIPEAKPESEPKPSEQKGAAAGEAEEKKPAATEPAVKPAEAAPAKRTKSALSR